MKQDREHSKEVSKKMETKSERVMRPDLDLFEDSSGYTLQADLPGVNRDHLDIRIDHNFLTIEADVDLKLPDHLDPLRADIRANHYRRRVELNEVMDSSAIDATMHEGVLTLRIPKRPESLPHKIEVRSV